MPAQWFPFLLSLDTSLNLGLTDNLIRNASRVLSGKNFVVGGFALNQPGDQYLRNGYYGIYQAAYGGGSIGVDRALCITALYAGIKIISEDVATLPLFTYESVGDGQRLAKGHPLYTLLHDSPNPDQTACQFRGAITANALLTGKGYARIERSRGDKERIIALWQMMPYEVKEDKDSAGRPVFIYAPAGGVQKTYTQGDVLQIPGFGIKDNDGLNILQYGRAAIGLAGTQEEYANRFFSQDQTPNIVLKHPAKLGPQGVAGVKKAWAGGDPVADSWFAPRVLQEGMGIEQLHPDNQASQLTEQRAFQLLEVARLLRMPPHKLGDLGRATWANLSAQNTQYYNETLRPWLVRWEQPAKKWLFGQDSNYYAEHEIGGFLRGDFDSQTSAFSTLLEKGVYSINEVRALMSLNPIDGGDDHYIQLNMATLEQIAKGAEPQPGETQPPAPAAPKRHRVGGKS